MKPTTYVQIYAWATMLACFLLTTCLFYHMATNGGQILIDSNHYKEMWIEVGLIILAIPAIIHTGWIWMNTKEERTSPSQTHSGQS